jgi:hypothetical protein
VRRESCELYCVVGGRASSGHSCVPLVV